MMIYTVTTIQTITDKGKDNDGTFWFPYPTFGDRRCWGYFASLEDALIAVDEYASQSLIRSKGGRRLFSQR